MQYNFFQWLRDGVRQAVLLGVSDAVETIGPAHDSAESQEKLQRTLGITVQNEQAARLTVVGPATSAPRRSAAGSRRLGKSLKDLGSAGQS